MSRRSCVVLLDSLAAGFAALVVVVVNTGGFILHVAGVRLSSRTPTRALVGLAAVLMARLVFLPRSGPFGVSAAGWRRLLFLPSGAESFQTRAAPGVWRRAVVASAALALALAALLHEQALHSYSVPDHGDPLFSVWRMGWVVHALFTDPVHLFDANIFYPLPLTLTLSDAIVLPALMGAPLRALGVHPVLVYNLLLFSGFWLSGVATYLLVERLTGSPRAAFIAGLIYATYSYRFDHYSHLELQMTQWMPLGLLALHLFISTGRWPYALALALAGVAQLYSGMYYAVFFFVYATAIGAGLFVAQRPSIRSLALPLAGAALVAGLLAAPIVGAFAAAESMKGERPIDEIRYYSATPADYWRAGSRSVLWSKRLLPSAPERALFPGAAPLVLGAIGLAPPLSPIRLVYAAGLFVAVDGSFGLNGLVYPYLYRWLAPFRGLRSPARFGAIVGLTLAIFSGFGAHRLLRRCRSTGLAQLVFALLVAGVLIDAWPAVNVIPAWREPPRIYEAIRGKPGVVLAEFPIRADAGFNAAYMYFSLWHWLPMVNGYSGFIPESYTSIPDLQDFPLGRSVAALRNRGVTHVTVNCGLRYVGSEDCETIIARIRRTPGMRLVADTLWEGARVELYELGPER